MVKVEPPSTESDSDSDIPQTPLAASTQRSPPPSKAIKSTESDGEDSSESDYSGDDNPPASQASIASYTPSSVKNTMEKYLAKFPFVRRSKTKNSVDIDLTDSDDEVWIVKCPTSINARKVLQGAKLESFPVGAVSKIHSSHTDKQLEGFVVKNAIQKPMTIMSGTEFKSFVPMGTIQIRESLQMDVIPATRFAKSEDQGTVAAIDVDEEIPFPEEIRERHPLLGLEFESALKLPKRVKKALSLARQRSDAFFLQKDVNLGMPVVDNAGGEQKEHVAGKRSKKRKYDELELASADGPTGDMIQMLIKEEAQSPSRKKKVKKEEEVAQPVDDDLSWLNNM